MGLDTSHDCWHGPYSMFMTWRRYLAKVAGLPPLDLMEGFYSPERSTQALEFDIINWSKLDTKNGVFSDFVRECLPISWDVIKIDPALRELLSHSDCDGEISWEICEQLATVLEALAEKMDPASIKGRKMDGNTVVSYEPRGTYDGFRNATLRFAAGCRRAFAAKENVNFH